MFSTPIRFLVISVSSAFGLYRLYSGSSIGVLFLLGAALLVYGHFRYGPVWLAFRHLRRGNLDRGAQLLAQVRDAAWLSSEQRAYFEFASAFLVMHREDYDAGERHLRAALDHRLRTQSDRALAEAMLSQLLIKRGAVAEARGTLSRARQRRSNPQVVKTIAEIEKSLPPSG